MMKQLQQQFTDRTQLIEYVKQHSITSDDRVSEIKGGITLANHKLSQCDVAHYAKTRNYLKGNVSRLSPYISRGIISNRQAFSACLARFATFESGEKFFQELAWRDYWQQVARQHPEWLWNDIEPYKTGWTTADYQPNLPDDIINASTDCACINHFITELISTGYLHNHARMYLASYIIHWRKIQWQVGAAWFISHLLDANLASNNLSWQWVASTFSHKPYIFNLDNVAKYADDELDTSPSNNKPLAGSYEQLSVRLFPHVNGAH